MKEKVFHGAASLLLFFALACLIIFLAGQKVSEELGFIITWTVLMSLSEIFLFDPLRKRYARKKMGKSQD